MQGLRYTGYEIEKRLPELLGTGAGIWTGGQRRYYASTDQRNRIIEAFDMIEPLRTQKSGENRIGETDFDMKRVTDPKARAMMELIRGHMLTGRMNVLQKQRSDINSELKQLDHRKGKINPREYHSLLNKYHKDMYQINDMQEDVINDLNFQLWDRFQTDIAGAAGYARDTLQQQ